MSDEKINSDIVWVIESKFQEHLPNTDLISRPRLLELLDEAREKKLVLLRAPAGYGKSALLGQWSATLKAQRLYVAWLTLDVSETEEKLFLAYFVLALDQAGVPVGDLMTGAQNGFEDSIKSQVLINIVNSLNAIDQKCVVVLEDYHVVECPQINEIVMRLLREVTTNLCLVIESRVLPELDALSLLVSGNAIEIPASALKLTEEETIEVLKEFVSAEDAKNVFLQTEGWTMAVQLAKLQRKTRPQASIDNLSQGHFIPSYLAKQVLSGLGEKERDFLLTASFLKRFNASITSHITGESDSFAIINDLKVLSPLIVPLDSKGGWYRLHHLFASYLRELLMLKGAEKPNEILLAASEWHALQGNIVQAVGYAADANAYERCHEIIANAGGWRVILNEGIGILRAALREIPHDEIAKSATSLIAKAYLFCKDGEIFDARAAIERAWNIDAVKDQNVEVDRLIVEAMLNLYEDRKDLTTVYLDLKRKHFDANKLPALERATIAAGESIRFIADADLDQADSILQKASAGMRESGSVLGLNYCYIHAAQIALYQGEMDLARATVKRALEMAEENFGTDSGLKNIAQLVDYSVLAWSGSLSEKMLTSFEQDLVQAMDSDGWTEVYILGLDAFVMVAMRFDMHEQALSTLRQFKSYASLFNLDRLLAFSDALIELLFNSDASLSGKNLQGSAEVVEHGSKVRNLGHSHWLIRLKTVGNILLESEVNIWQPEFDDAKLFVENRKLVLHEIVHGLHEVQYLGRNGAQEAAKTLLIEIIKKAASRKLMGPFLVSEMLLEMLYEIKQDCRQNDRDRIEYNFVSEILAQAKLKARISSAGLLSEREFEVLRILVKGMSNKEIARDLELTENTVKFHLKHIFSKLNVHKRTQAIIEAGRLGLV